MKQKTHRLLSLLLCLVMVLGLMPMTAFADGTREEVNTIKATAIINVPSYGEPTNYPTFTVTEGSPAYIATIMTRWEKKNTVTGKWDNVDSGNTFTEGTWRLSVQVRIDGEGGKTHKLSEKPRFFVNEVEWQIESKSRFDDYHFVSLAYFHSQEYEVTSSTLPQMYDITVTNGVAKNESYIDITKAKPGDKVVLLANDRRDEGLAFEKWVVTGATVDAENNMTAKFIMPEGNVTAEATYIPCDISIKAVKLTLGNYAVGKKASDISVKIIKPDVVDFSYGDTYRCYDEDGVALGGSYVLCYLEGETVKRLGADELIKEGVEYFLEVHIKSDEGYTFLGLKDENVTLDGTAGGAMFMQPNNAVYSFLPKPLKTVDLTLDNYAVGNKAGDISVEITTPGVLFSGSGEGSGEYNQGYQIAIPDGEWIGGTIAVRFLDPDEKLEAGADYDLFVFVKAADGSTLKDLTAANAKLDGKAAEAVDLLSDGVTAVIIFKLTPLGASHTHTYGTEWKSDAYKHWHECSCGAKSEEAAHTAGEWIIDTPATATTSGSKHKECTVCGYTMATETIPATGGGGGGSYYAPTAAVVPDMPMLYRGCTGDAVKTLQDKLNALGYNSGNVDGIFGAKTYAAVTAFQKANSLGVDGIVGKLTWGKLYGISPAMPVETTTVVGRPMVSYGSRGDAVRKLQELLNALGYDCGSVDGIFGSKTKAAVLAFQKANGLGADGIVGPLTWAKLG